MTITSLINEIHIWKKDATCILLLGIIVITSWIPRFRGPIDLRWDAGVYYVLGTSLAHGKGYRLLNEPGEILAIQYPPGLPAVIAIEQLILRSDDPVRVGTYLRLSWCVLSLLYGVCAFLLGRLFLPLGYAFLLSATCLLNYEMYFLSTLCFAELPFALCSTLFGYLYLRNNSGRLRQVLVPSAAIASYLIRSTGIALLGAWIADAALRKRYREAIARTIVALIPVILWHSYIHIVESSGDYRKPYYAYQRDPSMFYNVSYSTNVSLKSPFQPELGFVTKADLFVRIADNLKIIPRNLGEAVSAKEGFWKGHLTRLNRMIGPLVVPSWSVQVILVCLGFIAVAGMAWEFACREWFIPIYLLLTVGAVCMTTWVDQFPRYLAPIEPFL